MYVVHVQGVRCARCRSACQDVRCEPVPYPAKTNPDAIRAAAMELLEQEGDAALTLRRLASVLNLTPNALYRHFPSREVLIAAVADEVARRLLTAILQAIAEADAEAGSEGLSPEDRIHVLFEVYATFASDHPALYQTLMSNRAEAEAHLSKPLGHDLLWEQVIRVLVPLTGPEKAPASAVTLWALLHGLWGLQRADLLGGKKPADVGRFGVEALLRGL